ncbi:MAG: cytochrome c oxidase subunit II [Desulfuromonadales bacterium]|nr:cytochrome c oxidase subunit II [Desulfuromonadales bacterium]
MNPQPLITTTEAVDKAFYIIFGISGVMLLGVTVVMIYFVWRYNRKRYPVPLSQKNTNLWLETTWTIIPTILVMVMFWYGWEGYLSLRNIPDNAVPIHASARMWSWLFTYENGKTSDKLYVPVGQPVKVQLTAEDVLHSFYVPAFRVKRDTVPGMDNYVWFVADQPGSYDLFCAEYCGVGHSAMITTVEAVPAAEFSAWLAAKPAVSDAGKNLLQKHGCLGCHSLDGSPMVGPSFQDIGGRQVVVISDGESRTLTRDRDYLEKSILEPGADIVEGFPPSMPSYAGRIPEEDLTGILDYLTGLKGEQQGDKATPERDALEPVEAEAEAEAQEPGQAAEPAEAAGPGDFVSQGENLAGKNGCLGCHSTDGSRRVGPSFKGLMGSERTVVKDGQEITVSADADYLIRAIREPGVEIVQGYPAAMPPYPQLSDEDIKALQAWLETLK